MKAFLAPFRFIGVRSFLRLALTIPVTTAVFTGLSVPSSEAAYKSGPATTKRIGPNIDSRRPEFLEVTKPAQPTPGRSTVILGDERMTQNAALIQEFAHAGEFSSSAADSNQNTGSAAGRLAQQQDIVKSSEPIDEDISDAAGNGSAGHESALSFLQYPSSGMTRPGAGTDKADIVHFGLYGKTFYGVDLKTQEFTIDFVLTLQWLDPRTVTLVPAAQQQYTFSEAQAIGSVWSPGVQVLNQAGKQCDRLSWSLTVTASGWVTQVERILVVLKNRYVLNDYPFDSQMLELSVGPAQSLSSEVQLVPLEDKSFSGLRSGFFDGEDYVQQDLQMKASEDIDGPLTRSRGTLSIAVARSSARFQRNFLLPAFLYLAISCAVFWLPFSPTFVTPRVALSIFILLIFSSLGTRAESELPSDAPYNWLDLICLTIQLHMFTVLCLNVFTEVAYHSMKCVVTAVHINNELKVFAPVLGFVPMAAILIASVNLSPSLRTMTTTTPIMLAVLLTLYLGCCSSTLRTELTNLRQQEQMKQSTGGGLGPVASSESLAATRG